MKKRIFAAILAAAMMMSLVACGTETSVSENVESVIEETSASVAEATEEAVEEVVAEAEEAAEDVVVTGVVEDGVYTNEFFGFKIEAADGYAFATEETMEAMGMAVAKKLEGTNTLGGNAASKMLKEGENVVDCYLADDTMLKTTNVTVSFLGAGLTQEDMDASLDMILPELKATYEGIGLGDVTIEKETVNFLGEDHLSAAISGTMDADGTKVDMVARQVYIVKDGYMTCITVGSYVDDAREELLAMISTLN